jgi:hypothetical protein
VLTPKPLARQIGHLVASGQIWHLFWAAVFAYASVEEWRHMRRGMAEKDWPEVVGPAIAAVACGYMASESIEGNWP